MSLKGREPEWPNSKLNMGNYLKSSKMEAKTKHPTLPNHLNFQKCEFSVDHEIHFKHVFKIRGDYNSTFVG